MLWWCETNEILPRSQSGFRSGKLCVDNIINLTVQAKDTLANHKHLLAAFLDIRCEFDNVNCNILLQKLAEIGCSEKLICFISFLIHQRIIYNELTGKEYETVDKGVAQGGVLSPLLYIIYVKNIIDNLRKSVIVSQFADDIAVYSKFSPLKKCRNVIEKAVNNISKNLFDLGLDLAPQKQF